MLQFYTRSVTRLFFTHIKESDLVTKIFNRIRLQHNITKNCEIASLLKASDENIRTWKSRNKIPYKHLVVYCLKENISLDYILLGRGNAQYHI